MDLEYLLARTDHFMWDSFNREKNWMKHRVTKDECEEVILDDQVVFTEDPRHSVTEQRWIALGRTLLERHLFIAFTIRETGIRIISARPMNKKERRNYEATQANSHL